MLGLSVAFIEPGYPFLKAQQFVVIVLEQTAVASNLLQKGHLDAIDQELDVKLLEYEELRGFPYQLLEDFIFPADLPLCVANRYIDLAKLLVERQHELGEAVNEESEGVF